MLRRKGQQLHGAAEYLSAPPHDCTMGDEEKGTTSQTKVISDNTFEKTLEQPTGFMLSGRRPDDMNMEHLSLCTTVKVRNSRKSQCFDLIREQWCSCFDCDCMSTQICCVLSLFLIAAMFGVIALLKWECSAIAVAVASLSYGVNLVHQQPYLQLEPNQTVYLNNTSGYNLLIDALSPKSNNVKPLLFDSYFLLQNALDSQSNQAYCSVASVTGILNSLRHHDSDIEAALKRQSSDFAPNVYLSQHKVLNNRCTNRNVIRHNEGFDGIFAYPFGLGLTQTAKILECHLPSSGSTNKETTGTTIAAAVPPESATSSSATSTWSVKTTFIDEVLVSMDQMRRDLVKALTHPDGVAQVIINYDCSLVHQDGDGHFSPIAAYSKRAVSFLILDVAKYKYPPLWVPTSLLYQAVARTSE